MLLENNFHTKRLRLIDSDYISPDIVIIQNLKKLVENNFTKRKEQEFYCEELHVSSARLNTLTKTYLDRSVYQVIQDRIHAEALLLLTYTTLSVKQITYELGLSDQGYFCRCFKKVTGLRPSQYRKLYQVLPILIQNRINEVFSEGEFSKLNKEMSADAPTI